MAKTVLQGTVKETIMKDRERGEMVGRIFSLTSRSTIFQSC